MPGAVMGVMCYLRPQRPSLLLDMLPPGAVGLSPLTGVRAWALGKPDSLVQGLWTLLSGIAGSAHLGTSRDKNHGT